jgi:hypothetical protein
MSEDTGVIGAEQSVSGGKGLNSATVEEINEDFGNFKKED